MAKGVGTTSGQVPEGLKLAQFPGRIHLIETVESLRGALPALRSCAILGFDTESRPAFRKHEHYDVALVQLASVDQAWLIRTCVLGFPSELVALLEDEHILKVGASLRDDIHRLRQLGDFTPAGLIDMQPLAKLSGLEEQSVRKLAARVLGLQVSKRAQLTNWEAPALTPQQILYAATDAWICLRMIYSPLFAQALDKFHLELPVINLPVE